MPVVASALVAAGKASATITLERSTPTGSFLQPRWPRPPCFAAAHAPSPTLESPGLATTRGRGPFGGRRRQPTSRALTPPRARGVVGRVEVDVHQEQDRPQEAFRLAHGQAEDAPERQRGLDREI